MNGRKNVAPKDIPVKNILKTQRFIFPNFLDKGIQKGTERAEGNI